MGGKITDSPCGFDSAELRESNVQHDQVWLQRLGKGYGLRSIRRFEDGSQFQFFMKGRTDEPPKRFDIIYYQNPDRGRSQEGSFNQLKPQVLDSLLNLTNG